jgi:hypothetical protein
MKKVNAPNPVRVPLARVRVDAWAVPERLRAENMPTPSDRDEEKMRPSGNVTG